MTILHIETSTNVCSVAVSEGSECVFFKMNDEGMNHAALLSLFVRDALDFLKSAGKLPDAIAVSSGPGSYTGLRIGVSTAKGLCYGYEIPLIAVDTLAVMAAEAAARAKDSGLLLCPMIDARRMEVYTAVYNAALVRTTDILAEIITTDSYADLLSNNKVCFFGNGADKCKTVITHPNALFLDNIAPLASNMIRFATEAYEKADFADVAYFEPFYLKEFQATTPRKTL
ncbi:MAG: peptidase glycoprotease [Bacteroidetes bacterium]|nr:peptidase glycoprotease [Bacteroidota bacterium]